MKGNKAVLMKFLSTQGYKHNSPDRNRSVNVIPSGNITMKDVDFPVRGVDNLGNEIVMMPGREYTFPGDYVIETPYKKGGQTDNDREMVEGIADILTMVKDPANRKSIAKEMVRDFKREDVKYNLQNFLKMANVPLQGMQQGGQRTSAQILEELGQRAYMQPSPALDNVRVIPQQIMSVQEAKKLKAERDARELARRKAAIEASQKAASKPYFSKERWTAENLAAETGATGDKLRFFPNDPDSFVDEYLNPFKMVGDMASSLGRAPLNISKGNYGQAAMSVVTPVVVGATAGIGARSAGQFVNNLANPLAGAGEFLTTKTPLKNAYKYNPWAFKPNEANWYRQVGKSAIDDALETGIIREAGEEVSPRMYQEFQDQLVRMQGNGMNAALSSRRPASPFFGKGELFYPMGRKPIINKTTGKLSKNPAGAGSADYLIETSLPNESFQPAYVKGMGLGVPTEVGSTAILKPDPSLRNLENFNIYKQDWLRGYKPVNTPVNTPKQLPGFRSEIDWGKWNPDTPKYPELINEYNAIEESTKKAGTWMKNADGSPFKGTAEQFIQQQSSYFKKAFPKGAEKTYRGTFGEMNTERLAEVYPKGRGIFTGDLNTAKHYATSKGKLNELYHPKSKNSYEIDVEGRSWREVPVESLPGMTSDKMLLGKPVAAADDIATWAEKNNVDYVTMKNIFDGLDAKYSRVVNNKPGNFLKSAVGNVGFFDMSNPNIYKAAAPISIGLGTSAAQEYQKGGQHGGLDRWFAEKWVDVKTGKECGRQEGEKRAGYPACRPSKRVSEDTPKTASELSSAEKEKFKRSKTSSERIPYQHTRKQEGGEWLDKYGAQSHTNWLDNYNN